MIGIKEGDNIEAITVVGESMEPTLKDNSLILIDRDKIDVSKGGIFVVNTISGVYVKRITLSIATNGISLMSDNKNYPTEILPADEVTVVGKVIGALERV